MGRPCCLILEDQPLIGLALEASLEEVGFQVAGPFGTSSEALRWLGRRTPDLALIDVLLKDGPCLSVARELRGRNVPYAIYSGLQRPSPIAPEFDGIPWLEKPISRQQLAAILLKLRSDVSVISIVAPSPKGENTRPSIMDSGRRAATAP